MNGRDGEIPSVARQDFLGAGGGTVTRLADQEAKRVAANVGGTGRHPWKRKALGH